MTEAARLPTTSDTFIAWAMMQPGGERYELVAGQVVAMARSGRRTPPSSVSPTGGGRGACRAKCSWTVRPSKSIAPHI
jgi:hypothetical protein